MLEAVVAWAPSANVRKSPPVQNAWIPELVLVAETHPEAVMAGKSCEISRDFWVPAGNALVVVANRTLPVAPRNVKTTVAVDVPGLTIAIPVALISFGVRSLGK